MAHNLSRPRTTNRFLKPFSSQTSTMTQSKADESMPKCMEMTCAENTFKQTSRVTEKNTHSTAILLRY